MPLIKPSFKVRKFYGQKKKHIFCVPCVNFDEYEAICIDVKIIINEDPNGNCKNCRFLAPSNFHPGEIK